MFFRSPRFPPQVCFYILSSVHHLAHIGQRNGDLERDLRGLSGGQCQLANIIVFQAYLDFEERWKALTWKKIDLDLINKEVQSVEEVLERLKEKYSKAETLEEIVKRKDQVEVYHLLHHSAPSHISIASSAALYVLELWG